MLLASTLLLAYSSFFHADPETVKVTLLTPLGVHAVEHTRVSEEGELCLPADQLPTVVGLTLKPEGLCSAKQCIPIPEDAGWVTKVDGVAYVNVSRVAERVSQPVARDRDKRVYAFGEIPSERPIKLESGQAPDFAIADRTGKVVHLSDFRGKKVMILTWASWCGCSLDLVGWQKVYSELRHHNFELVAAAQDTAGEEAAGKFYDKAKAEFTTLLDTEHEVSRLYQMVNVPMGVWVDEEGRVVRPAEVAYTQGFRLFGKMVGDDRYEPALKDWVEKGASSSYVMPKEKLRAELAPRSKELKQAEQEFKLGVYFHSIGDAEAAQHHWKAAQSLDPDNWNYHRQDWSFDSKKAIVNWMKKVRELNGKPYYEPIEFPAENMK